MGVWGIALAGGEREDDVEHGAGVAGSGADAKSAGAEAGDERSNTGDEFGMFGETVDLEGEEAGKQILDILFGRGKAVVFGPGAADTGEGADGADLILFEETHGIAGFFGEEGDAAFLEETVEDEDRGLATVVDGGAGPIEDDAAEGTFVEAHAFSQLVKVCSARPKERVMPAPPGAVTMRTAGCGEAVK